MLNRRTFLASSAAAALIAAVLRPATAQALPLNPDETFLNRLTFGATPDERTALAAMGRAGWLDDQLSRPARDPVIDARLASTRLRIWYEAAGQGDDGSWGALDELRPLALDTDPAELLTLIDWERDDLAWPERVRPGDEVIHAALIRAVHAPAQLREVMTQFWHDHFNVHAMKDEYTAIYFPQYDAMLRDHAFGNFRAMLGDMARSPAMLHYLNNAESSASPANENFARELLELHTLGAGNYLNHLYARWAEVPRGPDGVASGYIDEDVYEVARAFTGWTIGDGRWISEGVEADRSGRFYYAEGWHDPYQKRVLGVEFPPNRAAMADGDQVMDILAQHPGTATFVCTKIARRLLSDDPDPALVARMADLFRAQWQAPDQIAQVIRLAVTDPAFDAPPAKMRRPFEYMVALLRASGAKVTATETGYHWQLSRAGWLQHTFPPPTGHPDRAENWQSGSALLRMIDYALYIHDEWFGITNSRLSQGLPSDVATLGDLARHWTTRMTGSPDDLGVAIAAMGANPDDALPEDEVSRHDLSVTMVAMAALSPQFFQR